jgi:epoxyqueuosine reductase
VLADPQAESRCFERVGEREERTIAIKERAIEIGFDKVGVARAGDPDPKQRLRAWLDRGFHGGMDYMERTAETRAKIDRWLEGAQSVVALAISYYRPSSAPRARVARYAWGDDYHRVVRKKVLRLRKYILSLDPSAKVAPSLDYSPVLERAWAERAGIAWIGKSTMAIAQDLGTYTFLATLVTNMDLVPDEPHVDRCGSCTKCIDACPTDAFVGPRELDARKCITYWTVEHRGDLGPDVPSFHGWIAGCDICQEVCPWNKFARSSSEPRMQAREALAAPDLLHLAADRAAVEEAIEGTALQRTGADAIQRNVRRVLDEEF